MLWTHDPKKLRGEETDMDVNVIIVGGGPADIITALTAKSIYPEKSVFLIKDIGDSVIPCAIPYMMHTLNDPKQNEMGNLPLEKAGIDILVGKVVSLDISKRAVTMESGQIHSYERLVLATGTKSVIPPIPGAEKEGVYTIKKSMSAMTMLREKVHKAKQVVIIGGGFIGAEFADELSRVSGLDVHLIEIMPKLLYTAFDDEFCNEVSQALGSTGVNLHTSKRVVSINGNSRVESVTLEGGETISADMVLISIGAKPSIDLAEEAGLRITDNGSIWVDDYMQTDADGIFAV